MGQSQEQDRVIRLLRSFDNRDDLSASDFERERADAVLSLLNEERPPDDVKEHVTDVGKGVIDTWPTYDDLRAERDLLREQLAVVTRERDALRTAILDIDAHAVARATDEHGFNAGGYVISIGSLHRALGLIGHTSPECSPEHPCSNCEREAVLLGIIRRLLDGYTPDKSFDPNEPTEHWWNPPPPHTEADEAVPMSAAEVAVFSETEET